MYPSPLLVVCPWHSRSILLPHLSPPSLACLRITATTLHLPRCCCSERAPRWSGCGRPGSAPSARRCCTGDLCCSECTSTWAKKQRLQEQDTGLHSDTPRDKAFRSAALFTSTCPRHATYKAACPLSHPRGVWCLPKMVSTAQPGFLPHLSARTPLLHPPWRLLSMLGPPTPMGRGGYFPGRCLASFQGKTNCRAPSPFASLLLNLRIIISLEVILLRPIGLVTCPSAARKDPARGHHGNSPSALFGSGSHYQLTEQLWEWTVSRRWLKELDFHLHWATRTL